LRGIGLGSRDGQPEVPEPMGKVVMSLPSHTVRRDRHDDLVDGLVGQALLYRVTIAARPPTVRGQAVAHDSSRVK